MYTKAGEKIICGRLVSVENCVGSMFLHCKQKNTGSSLQGFSSHVEQRRKGVEVTIFLEAKSKDVFKGRLRCHFIQNRSQKDNVLGLFYWFEPSWLSGNLYSEC